jgi:Domain of Unknown Function (DUF1206)
LIPTSNPFFNALARVGFLARGAIYVAVGFLAARAAFWSAGRPAGLRGAMNALLLGPYGPWVLGGVAAGLLAFAAWRLAQAVYFHGFFRRASALFGAVASAALGTTAIRLLLHLRGGSSAATMRALTRRLIVYPSGRYLLVATGALTIVVALVESFLAVSGRFRHHIKLSEMSPGLRLWAARIARLGLLAHGVVLGVIGTFLMRSGLESDSSEVKELGGALSTLSRPPFAPLVMGSVAIGLMAYGLYLWILSGYRRR